MVTFPNGKINIGLNIIGKRADGFHNLETVFYPIAVKDAVEIINSPEKTPITFSQSGLNINVKDEDNICIKAYHLLKKDFTQIPNIKMHLHKNIPMGAGLGGGSADAAAILLMLNQQYHLQIPKQKLIDYSLQLGSDCPFFILNKPSFAKGRGEALTEININLAAYKIMIVNPAIAIYTGEAFASLQPAHFSPAGLLQTQIMEDITCWKTNIKNDFEIPIFKKYPAIENIKNTLYQNGAIYSAMSGSGSTVFGIFKKENMVNINFPAHYFCQMV